MDCWHVDLNVLRLTRLPGTELDQKVSRPSVDSTGWKNFNSVLVVLYGVLCDCINVQLPFLILKYNCCIDIHVVSVMLNTSS